MNAPNATSTPRGAISFQPQPSETPNLKTRSRNFLRTIAFGATAALAPLAGAAPFADSAVGTGTLLGNAMNRSSDPSRSLDLDWPNANHTPSGQMFKLPFAVPKLADLHKAASGWEYSGQLEVGVIGGDADERNAQFRTFQDVDNGTYVNNFSLLMTKPEGGYTIEVTGGGAGRHDQFYSLQFGRANDWKVKIFFNETPHIFTDSYKSLWKGIGTANLTLLPGLTPGGTASTPTDNANIIAAATGAAPMSLGLTRKKGGVRVDATLSPTWKGYVSYSLERRQGARPFGAVWGNNGGTAPIEIAEPIDYDTHEILAGLQHASGLNAFNFRVSASLFRNRIDTLTFQEPYRIAPQGFTTVPAAGAYTQGRLDLTPSNEAYNARAEYTRSLPDFFKGHFTAVVSAGTWRQDDTLIPYTTIPNLTTANITLLPGGAWDTTGALSRKSADATIDTRLVDLTLSLQPTPALNVKAKARVFETNNNTDPFLAVNPNAIYLDADAATAGNQSRGLTFDGVTGVWGRPLNDASGSGSLLMAANANPAGNIPIKSNPYSAKQYRFGPTAEYRLNNTSNLTAGAEREIMQRRSRERARTWDDKYKLGYVNRGLGESSLRVSYEFAQRRGSPYVTNYYDDFLSSALVPMPTTVGANVTSWAVRNNSGFRSYDLSDRDQHTGNIRLDTMVRANLDAGISLQAKAAKYPDAAYGRTRDDQTSANLDLNYQPSPRQNIYAFYSYQLGHLQQASIVPTGTVTIGQVTPFGIVTPANAAELGAAPGGTFYPLINTWTAKSTDRNHVLGAGLKQEIGKASLNVDYSYATGRTRIGYTYTPGGAISVANAAFAGSRPPDLATDVTYLDASLRFPLTDRLTARLVYRHQKESIRDWHYQNLATTPVVLGGAGAAAVPTAIILDGGPQSYHVEWFGVMVQIKL